MSHVPCLLSPSPNPNQNPNPNPEMGEFSRELTRESAPIMRAYFGCIFIFKFKATADCAAGLFVFYVFKSFNVLCFMNVQVKCTLYTNYNTIFLTTNKEQRPWSGLV